MISSTGSRHDYLLVKTLMGNTVQLEYANMKKRNEECYNLLTSEPEMKVVKLESRVMGCNLRLRSRRIVFGCLSQKASLNSVISSEKKWKPTS